jgi:hypothetical protein
LLPVGPKELLGHPRVPAESSLRTGCSKAPSDASILHVNPTRHNRTASRLHAMLVERICFPAPDTLHTLRCELPRSAVALWQYDQHLFSQLTHGMCVGCSIQLPKRSVPLAILLKTVSRPSSTAAHPRYQLICDIECTIVSLLQLQARAANGPFQTTVNSLAATERREECDSTGDCRTIISQLPNCFTAQSTSRVEFSGLFWH